MSVLGPGLAIASRIAALGPAPAHGDGVAAVELHWRAPAGCPDGAVVRRELGRYSSRTAASAATAVRVEARVEPTVEGYALVLEVDAPGGLMRQRIVADRCEVLASATALVVAVLLDPAGVVEVVESAVTPVAAPPPEPAPPPATSMPVTPPRARRRAQALLRFAALADFGALPRLGAAFAGAVGVRARLWRVELVAAGALPQDAKARANPAAGARVDAWWIGPRGCVAPAVRTVEFPVCLGLDVGQIRARGFGLRTSRRTASPWVAFPLGAMVLWAPVRRFAFGGGIEGWLATSRPRFVIDDLGPVHRAGRAGVRGFVTVELRLP